MKKLLLLTILIFTIGSCSKRDDGDTTRPSVLTVDSVTPTNGGGIISYTLPNDNDILYVRADYTNSNGVDVSRASSSYNNSIEIDGLNQTTALIITLYVVDENYNQSAPIYVELVPLESFIYLVQESIEVNTDLGGFRITWENIQSKTVYVFVHIDNGVEEEIRILSSNNSSESIAVRGLPSEEISISTRIEDFDENSTTLEEKGTLTPLFEQVIDKSTWTLVSSQSVNGNAWEGASANFWDDVIDTTNNNSDNSYFMIWRDLNGGSLDWPLDLVIDLNKNVKITRFTVWQRAFWYNGPSDVPYYFQEENMKSFNLYASNDAQVWEELGQFDIGDPRDSEGNIPQSALDSAANGHEFELDEVSETFRYLKFRVTSNYGSEAYVNGSEITMYGLDNL
ncbi:MAG: DUF4959 domain-containing protein [Candidatus Marinimicrobia bacterium]|nr:DUF4959 domain-containing protein [Candidatus Neomarinimicrobiota bacterium]MDA1363932.1 DUF4959 domain-containing protein [Candidatus Neomarinimicrobiota bacterium]